MEEYPKISLKAARINAELTQKEAARQIGIAENTLKRYEKGITAPRVDTMEKMSKVYGLPRNCMKV